MKSQEEIEIIWRFYQEYIIHSRHQQTLRAAVSGGILAIDAAMFGIIGTSDKWPLPLDKLPITIFLLFLGILGAIFVAKFHQLYTLYLNRARVFREQIAANMRKFNMKTMRNQADRKTTKDHPILYEIQLNHFWTFMHIFIALAGLLLSVHIFIKS